ncbi:MAG: hypothetical protein ACK5N8_06665 [Alphaproteobacteria bacterium]
MNELHKIIGYCLKIEKESDVPEVRYEMRILRQTILKMIEEKEKD